MTQKYKLWISLECVDDEKDIYRDEDIEPIGSEFKNKTDAQQAMQLVVEAAEKAIGSTKKHFTVIGFWQDTHQRFMDYVKAPTADEAERKILSNEKLHGLGIVAVIEGYHLAWESNTLVQFAGDVE
jgi:hypothetical protein